MQLLIGNKNYSSWSLRPWLLMKHMDIAFEELMVPLYVKGSKEQICKFSPSGKVPALKDGEVLVWDSLAICEYIADTHTDKPCWPTETATKAFARSISNEMHSGFSLIRNSLPMNCRKKMQFNDISTDLQVEIDRICEIWRLCRQKYSTSGEFLFGSFSIADAMFAPVVLRFNSYGIAVGAIEKDYMDKLLSHTDLKDWIKAGLAEKAVILASEI
jgi:glutathione S-transferase